METQSKTKAWLQAFRLRTLPLSLSSIFLGSFLAYAYESFNWVVLGLAVLTTLFLQVLSNLANDYGDAVSGADNEDRIGPQRTVQSGLITKEAMKKAIIVCGTLAFLSGISLIYLGTQGLNTNYLFGFLGLGIAAIWAAIKYTVGKNPYGYIGLGDVFVFLFFGMTGVMGTYFLHTHRFDFDVLLPAAAVGFLSVGVLNLNNMRDRLQDQRVGKNTMAVKLGFKGAKIYHTCILLFAIFSAILFTIINWESPLQLLFLASFPLIIKNLLTVLKIDDPKNFDPLLKKLALSTLLFALTFGIGFVLGL